jgi:pimeloyl-ACP methyl ester carboxylesterase
MNAYSFVKYLIWCREFIESIGWNDCNVLGHSLGANIAMVYGGTYPDLVNKLVLIEGFGPFSMAPETASSALRTALDAERSMVFKRKRGPKLYSNLLAAVEAKTDRLKQYPGRHQTITHEAAMQIIARFEV